MVIGLSVEESRILLSIIDMLFDHPIGEAYRLIAIWLRCRVRGSVGRRGPGKTGIGFLAKNSPEAAQRSAPGRVLAMEPFGIFHNLQLLRMIVPNNLVETGKARYRMRREPA